MDMNPTQTLASLTGEPGTEVQDSNTFQSSARKAVCIRVLRLARRDLPEAKLSRGLKDEEGVQQGEMGTVF